MSDSARRLSNHVGEWIITGGAMVTVLSLLGSNWFNEARQQEDGLHQGGRWDLARHQCVDE